MSTTKIALCLVTMSLTALAQRPSHSPAAAPAPDAKGVQATPFSIAERTQNSRVWTRTVWTPGPAGALEPSVRTYTELASGLHYRAGDQWVDTEEIIESAPGGAVARRGPHQVMWPNDILDSPISITTPDGRVLKSQLVGISYMDHSSGSNVWIAEVQSAAGVLSSSNQVTYERAFTDINASVRYTYTRAGVEQDVVIHERPGQTPSDYGLNPATCTVQVISEFTESAEPTVEIVSGVPGRPNAQDAVIRFGGSEIGKGKAFTLGTPGRRKEIGVQKQWIKAEGRTFLIEEIPAAEFLKEVESLNPPEGASVDRPANSLRHIVSQKRIFPRLAQQLRPSGREMRVAQSTLPNGGFLLDYVLQLSGDQTNYVFGAGAGAGGTFLISGPVNLVGATVFTGGCTIKFSPGASISFGSGSSVAFPGDLPVVFTAKDDDSIAEIVNGSTGAPQGRTYADPALKFVGSSYLAVDASNLRICFANVGIYASAPSLSLSVSDAQLVDCAYPLYVPGQGSVRLRNVLMGRFQSALKLAFASVTAEQVTFDGAPSPTNYVPVQLVTVADGGSATTINLLATNCVFANLSAFCLQRPEAVNGRRNGFYGNGVSPFGIEVVSSGNSPFESAAAGNYYLSADSPFKNAGVSNMDPLFLAGLRKRTTSAPQLLSNVMFAEPLTLRPTVPRDLDALDLGWHYQPIDIIAESVAMTNAALTLRDGVVIGCKDSTVFLLRSAAELTSTGSPVRPNQFVDYRVVQEQPLKLGGNANSAFVPMNFQRMGGTPSAASLRFTDFNHMGNNTGSDIYLGTEWRCSSLSIRDCTFVGGRIWSYDGTGPVTFANNLFINEGALIAGAMTLDFRNNTVRGPAWTFECYNPVPWSVTDNIFVDCFVEEFGDTAIAHHHNAFVNSTTSFYESGTNEFTLASLGFVSGPLGSYYLPASPSLADQGSQADAGTVGLYHHTTSAAFVNQKQIKEGNSRVDLGFHYVALADNGSPLDFESDGLPDYWEDANGNGVGSDDPTSWTIYNSQNQLSAGAGLKVYTPRD